jgi:hypothetical protein
MAKYSGTAAVVEWHYNGATYNLTGNFTKYEINNSADTIDVSSGNVTAMEYLPGMEDVTYSIDGFYGGAGAATVSMGTSQLAALHPRNQGTLVIGEFGTASGQPKLGGVAIVTSQPLTTPFGASGAIEVKHEFQGTGGMLWTHGSAF